MGKRTFAIFAVMLMAVGSVAFADATPQGRIVIQAVLTPETDHNDYHVHCGGVLNYAEKVFFIDQVAALEGAVPSPSVNVRFLSLDVHNGAATVELPPIPPTDLYRIGTYSPDGTVKSLLYFWVSSDGAIITLSETNRKRSKVILVEIDPSQYSVWASLLTDAQFSSYFSQEDVSKRNEAQVRALAGQK